MTSSTPNGVVTLLHGPLSAALAAASGTVTLASPYLGAGTARELAALAAASPASWSLLTVLDPVAAAYGSLSVDGLRELAGATVNIRHAPGLHAKVSLVDGTAGWVGSANLTASGLGGSVRPNMEMSVPLTAAQVAEAAAVVGAWWSAAAPVTAADLDECEARARLVPVRTSPPPGGGGGAGPADGVLDDALDAGVWVKAVYQDAARADAGWGTGSFVTSSKRGRPSFADGDLLVVYAKQAKVCNAVLEAVGLAYVDRAKQLAAGIPGDDADRWPWITDVDERLHVPAANGIPLADLGLTGRSLQGGHCRMPVGGLAAAVRHMTA